jgi:spore coat protein U-like protein
MRSRGAFRTVSRRLPVLWGLLAMVPFSAAQALVLGTCSVSASGVAFGTYDPTVSTALVATGTVTVTCVGVLAVGSANVTLSTGASNTFSARTLSSGTDTLAYNLYQNAADTIIWGDGSGSSQAYTLLVNGIGLVISTATIYGLVPALQNPSPGSYTDTITVTVSY